MKYQLTIDDYVKSQLHFMTIYPKNKRKYLAWRVLIVLLFEFLCFALTGMTANAYIMLFGLIFLAPVWLLTKAIYRRSLMHKYSKSLRQNPVYLAETEIEINGGAIAKTALGQTASIPINSISRVSKDDNFIYFESGGEWRIVPLRAFQNEMQKANFIDALSVNAKN